MRRVSFSVLLISLLASILHNLVRLANTFKQENSLKKSIAGELTPKKFLIKLTEIDSERMAITYELVSRIGDLLPTLERMNLPQVLLKTRINKLTVGFFGLVGAISEIISINRVYTFWKSEVKFRHLSFVQLIYRTIHDAAELSEWFFTATHRTQRFLFLRCRALKPNPIWLVLLQPSIVIDIQEQCIDILIQLFNLHKQIVQNCLYVLSELRLWGPEYMEAVSQLVIMSFQISGQYDI